MSDGLTRLIQEQLEVRRAEKARYNQCSASTAYLLARSLLDTGEKDLKVIGRQRIAASYSARVREHLGIVD